VLSPCAGDQRGADDGAVWCVVAVPKCALTSAGMRTQAIAAEFAQDEANHVAWLQQNLGVAAIPMPQVRCCEPEPAQSTP